MPDAERWSSDWRGWLGQQFLRCAALVRAVIWNRLGRIRDRHLVEELAAETWARAVRGVRAPEFDTERDFAPWVCAIAGNVCREHFRRQQRTADVVALERLDELQDVAEYQQAQRLLELHRALAECLAGLTADERNIYHLRFEQGLSGRATAQALGVPESTFREKLLAGLFAKLARCLAAKGFDELLGNFSAQRDPIGQTTTERTTS